MPKLITCRAGSRIGAPLMLPLSLAKAITEPEKVIAPMATPRPISTRLSGSISPSAWRMPKAAGLRKAAAPTSTAARPTRLWNAATSCGIAVIWMRRAVVRPTTAPSPTAAAILASVTKSSGVGRGHQWPGGIGAWVSKVVTVARAMPAMPLRLPARELAGDDRPRSARMNRTPDAR
jgi:hypothetical protein